MGYFKSIVTGDLDLEPINKSILHGANLDSILEYLRNASEAKQKPVTKPIGDNPPIRIHKENQA